VVEAMGLNVASRSPAMASPPYRIHPTLSTGSKVISGGTHRQMHIYIETDRQTCDLINVLSFLESRLTVIFITTLHHVK
jgi:hypothetical protein